MIAMNVQRLQPFGKHSRLLARYGPTYVKQDGGMLDVLWKNIISTDTVIVIFSR